MTEQLANDDGSASLEYLQEDFLSALQHPLGVEHSRLSIKASSRLSEADCLAIYQRSYYSRLLSCMREQFPALCHALGQEVFDEFSLEYLKSCAPETYTLYALGERFPRFLCDTRPKQEGDEEEVWVNFMIDLANFERRVFVMFDAEGSEGAVFAGVDTPDEALVLQPCVEFGAYGFDVAGYYHGVRYKQDPSLPVKQSTRLALVRKQFLTHTLYLSEVHYHFLSVLKSGGTIGEGLISVSTELNLSQEQVELSWKDPQGLRQRWIESGFFLDSRG